MLVSRPLLSKQDAGGATSIADLSTADRKCCLRNPSSMYVVSIPCSFDLAVSLMLWFAKTTIYIPAANVAVFVIFGSKRHLDE